MNKPQQNPEASTFVVVHTYTEGVDLYPFKSNAELKEVQTANFLERVIEHFGIDYYSEGYVGDSIDVFELPALDTLPIVVKQPIAEARDREERSNGEQARTNPNEMWGGISPDTVGR